MAKFLIYNKSHWMELPSGSEPLKTGYEKHIDRINSLPIPEVAKTNMLNALSKKNNARPIFGDIVEPRNDDSSLCGKELLNYLLLQVSGVENPEQYCGSLKLSEQEIKYNHKCSIDLSGISFDEDKEASISLSEFNNRLVTKE